MNRSTVACRPAPAVHLVALDGGPEDFSVFVRLLPLLEQQAPYNVTNFNLTAYAPQNSTLSTTGIAAFWCPSDYGVTTPTGA